MGDLGWAVKCFEKAAETGGTLAFRGGARAFEA